MKLSELMANPRLRGKLVVALSKVRELGKSDVTIHDGGSVYIVKATLLKDVVM